MLRNRRHRGVALVVAIWVLAILLVMVAGFAAMVHSSVEVARNFGGLTQARWAAHAGIARGEAEIAQLLAQPALTLNGESTLSILSTDEEIDLGGATFQVDVEDEAGKVNINTAPAEVLQLLFPPEVADSIIDWRDADSTPEPQGAEDEYYNGLASPYLCRNAPFATLDELLLVKGVMPELLDAPLTDDGVTLRQILTVSSVDSNTDAQGQARVNLATADQQTLVDAAGGVFTTQQAAAIVQQRTGSAFTSPADLLQVNGITREQVASVFDKFTVTDDTERQGLVNINTAPAAVLAVLPGMDEATAQAIITYRQENGPFADVGQLLQVEEVSDSIFMRIANLLTTRSRTFRLTATGQTADGITQTTTCVLRDETTGGSQTTRMLFWRE